MELQFIVMTFIKILISVPAVVLVADAAALIGGHVNNNSNIGLQQQQQQQQGDNATTKTNSTGGSYDFKIDLSDDYTQDIIDNSTESTNSEEIPDPSPLIVSGYNLPDNIFNSGKPFYLEKNPLTGSIDFNSRSPPLIKVYDDEEYEYPEESYEKASIDRKDGPLSLGAHKPSDINQLTPNFHDFLNLPVKYNPDKYVYPLISNSYANTKVQGNVNKQHNHKNYVVTTYKPTLSPTYFTTRHYAVQNKIIEFTTTPATTTSTTTPATTTVMATVATPKETLMDSPMNHPSFNEEFYSPTTKKVMSLFEQLFGDYDDVTMEPPSRPPPKLFNNLPSNKNVITGSSAMGLEFDTINTSSSTTTTTTTEAEFEEYEDLTSTTSTTTTTTTVAPVTEATKVVTSLPLGENHVTHHLKPIVVQNIREQLEGEKVVKFGGVVHPQAPSTSNIHIAPDQDTVSFVVGNHQNVDGGGYVGTSLKESPYDNNPFRPVYSVGGENEETQVTSIQPIRSTETYVAIGSPLNGNPGLVVDGEEEPITKGAKIVFPDERRTTTHPPDLSPPPPPGREVLKLNSKPMFHQLPSDLTPPNEKRPDRVRPPWDPRPGHFHAGRPEYARPPRPAQEIYKRIDNLPNILPQFRPNMKHHYNNHHHHHHHPPKAYARQPLLERPSNRPVGFFEKLHPPPPPPTKIPDIIPQNDPEPFAFLQAPPKIVIANRRNGDDPETLQMIQAKKDTPKQTQQPPQASFKTNLNGKDSIEKPLYVVYPVNTPPLKLDVIDTNKKETVVIGTRAEPPLPPSKIADEKTEFKYEMKERNDAPILKPRPSPIVYPIKSDFPYHLERPDPSSLSVPDGVENKLPDEPTFVSSNQWNTIEEPQERIINTPPQTNQISATLKTYTEKPIAVAYTPTEGDKFSLPNYGSLVIPEIRPGSEFTVGAVMHARPQKLDRIDEEAAAVIAPPLVEQEFQAPFQASAHVDHSISQGWSVVRDVKEDAQESTTLSLSATSEFDIENFKPQLEGGFKPIYSYPEDKKEAVGERQER